MEEAISPVYFFYALHKFLNPTFSLSLFAYGYRYLEVIYLVMDIGIWKFQLEVSYLLTDIVIWNCTIWLRTSLSRIRMSMDIYIRRQKINFNISGISIWYNPWIYTARIKKTFLDIDIQKSQNLWKLTVLHISFYNHNFSPPPWTTALLLLSSVVP